jgi:hypothetical protein
MPAVAARRARTSSSGARFVWFALRLKLDFAAECISDRLQFFWHLSLALQRQINFRQSFLHKVMLFSSKFSSQTYAGVCVYKLFLFFSILLISTYYIFHLVSFPFYSSNKNPVKAFCRPLKKIFFTLFVSNKLHDRLSFYLVSIYVQNSDTHFVFGNFQLQCYPLYSKL